MKSSSSCEILTYVKMSNFVKYCRPTEVDSFSLYAVNSVYLNIMKRRK